MHDTVEAFAYTQIHLFSHKALALVLRTKAPDTGEQASLTLPAVLPDARVIDFRC